MSELSRDGNKQVLRFAQDDGGAGSAYAVRRERGGGGMLRVSLVRDESLAT